jgi:hypothetical protein
MRYIAPDKVFGGKYCMFHDYGLRGNEKAQLWIAKLPNSEGLLRVLIADPLMKWRRKFSVSDRAVDAETGLLFMVPTELRNVSAAGVHAWWDEVFPERPKSRKRKASDNRREVLLGLSIGVGLSVLLVAALEGVAVPVVAGCATLAASIYVAAQCGTWAPDSNKARSRATPIVSSSSWEDGWVSPRSGFESGR